MSSTTQQTSDDYRWLVRSHDGQDVAEKRKELHAEHAARLKAFKAEHPGVLEYGGPILDPTTKQAKGSVLHLLYGPVFDSKEKVQAFLDADAFNKNQVYDASKTTIELYHAKHFPLAMNR